MSVAHSPRILRLGIEIDPCQQWVVVRAEDAGSAIVGVFVEPVNSSSSDDTAPVTHKDVVQHQARQGMESVTPGRNGRGNAKGKPRCLEQSPGGLVSATTEIQVRTQHCSGVLYLPEQVPRLVGSAGSPEPPVSRRSAGVKVSAYQPQSRPGYFSRCRHGNTALQHKRQLYCAGILEREC
jgi:hypothetical protein